MKILHINSYYGYGIFYKNLFDKQIEASLDIDVFLPLPKKTSFNVDLGDYTTVSNNHGKYDRLFFHLKHKKILKDIEKKYIINKYSIIHAHSLFSNGYIAMKLKEKYGIPYVVAVRNTDVNIFFNYMIHLRKLGVKILKEADCIIFLSKPYRDFVTQNYVPIEIKNNIVKKSHIIPNGIDNFWFKHINNARQNLKNKDIKLLYVGVIDKNKNILTTIEAIKLLQSKGYNIQYSVVGKIVDKDIYNKIITFPELKYVSPKSKEELINIYREHDIFVMPSLHETFGLVFAEAMSQGLPVIYSRGQGFDGHFEDGLVGYSVDSNSSIEIAEKIQSIVSEYMTFSKNCIEKVDKFSWDKISNDYYNLYANLLNNSK